MLRAVAAAAHLPLATRASRPRAMAAVASPTSSLPGAAEAADVAVVYVTAPTADVAASLARSLVEDRLAACVNVVPGVSSTYRWNGAVQTDAEALMILKTRRDRLPALTAAVRARHPYDEPEVVAVPAVGGSPSYLAWVLSEAAPAENGGGTG